MSDLPFPIIIAENDDDDILLIKEAFQENQIANPLHFVKDGEELLDFLRHKGEYADLKSRQPGLILLDLNMPRKDGREALAVIKQDPKFRRIPIVVLTTSSSETDILKTYDLGVNSFINKPVSFDSLVHIIKTLHDYWFAIVRIPRNGQI